MATREARVSTSTIYTDEGTVSVQWVTGGKPIQVEVPKGPYSALYLFLSAEEAYSLGSALVEHAEASGYNPETGETEASTP